MERRAMTRQDSLCSLCEYLLPRENMDELNRLAVAWQSASDALGDARKRAAALLGQRCTVGRSCSP